MVDKDLFFYDLAVVAILKSEGRYLKEWLDYHLAAGVDHFYLYDNDSPDNQVEVAAPYVKAGLVDYFFLPGKCQQPIAYITAVDKFKFHCRYMAIIDLDEFVYPKLTKVDGGGHYSIVEVLDEILSHDQNAAGLVINWHTFGSNGQEKADYSRGVLERFTRRAPNDWYFIFKNKPIGGNPPVKSIHNPRKISSAGHPHIANYFESFHAINEKGNIVKGPFNIPVTDEKIVINHYYTKSFEEFITFKRSRGYADRIKTGVYTDEAFKVYDRNEEFDDGILKYRDARAKVYQPPKPRSNDDLIKALKRNLPLDAPPDYYAGKLETFLTCRAVAAYLKEKTFEEASLKAIIKAFASPVSVADKGLFDKELPELLKLPYPVVEELHKL